jgi:hypothetical protein
MNERQLDSDQATLQRALELEPTARPAFSARAAATTRRCALKSNLCSKATSARTAFWRAASGAEWRPARSDMIGQCVGDYRIVGEAGRGGTSIVYLAERADQQFDKRVAIKMLRSFDESAEILQRFRMERQTLAKLDHPNIVTLLDGGTTADGMPYLVMDFVEGIAIDRYCDQHAAVDQERLKLFCAVCDTVEYAHRNGVIHRDLKPSNILVTDDGVPTTAGFRYRQTARPEALRAEHAGHTQRHARHDPGIRKSRANSRGADERCHGYLFSGRSAVRAALRAPPIPHDWEARLLEWERAVCEQEPLRPSIAAARERPSNLPRVRSATAAMARRRGPARLGRTLRGDLDASP